MSGSAVELSPRLTYGEMRSNAERIADEVVKARVLAGIALLNSKYGPDWVDRVDLPGLDLSSATECVLGQVYAAAEATEAEWDAYLASPAGGRPLLQREASGYERGLAILDGDLTATEDGAGEYGFLVPDEGNSEYDYEDLTDAWVVALGGQP